MLAEPRGLESPERLRCAPSDPYGGTVARRMIEVELVGDDPPAGGPGPDPVTEWLRRVWTRAVGGARRAAAFVVRPVRRAWRRPWVRWVASVVAVAVVAVSVTVHVTGAARERARLAALALVPGVVRPLHPGLRALYQVPSPDSQVLTQGFRAGDTLVGAVSATDDGWSVVGLDAATGARRWSTSLEPVDAPAEQLRPPMCRAAEALVFCTAAQVTADPLVSGWQTATWVLDPADGHLIRTMAYDEHTWATVAGGLVVEATQSDGPRRAPAAGPWTVTWTVTASDPATGAVQWTWTSPPVAVTAAVEDGNVLHDPSDYESGVTRWPGAVDDVAVSVGDDTWVLRADGLLRTHVSRPGGWWVSEDGGSLLRSPQYDPTSIPATAPRDEMLTDDGSWKSIDGTGPAGLMVDDGSAPDVLLRASFSSDQHAVLTAVDRHTGATLWQTSVGSARLGYGAVLLEGRVYVGADTLRAIDATTGHVIWTSADTLNGRLVATDGRVLLVQAGNEVTARSMDDGRVLWRDDLPASVLGSGVTETDLMPTIGVLPQLRRLLELHQDQSVVVLG